MENDKDKTEKATILLVDDTPDNLSLISGLLKDYYKIKVATSGESALRIACGANPPDLILLDVVMPEMDGYEVCRRLKANPQTHGIPVIFMTARTSEDDEQMGRSVGAVDFVAKPVDPLLLLQRIGIRVKPIAVDKPTDTR